jgi:hypothetical protein
LPGLLERQVLQRPLAQHVSGGVHQVVQLADTGEQGGHVRLAAGVGHGPVAVAWQSGERGVQSPLVARCDGDGRTRCGGGAGRSQSHSRTAADDDNALVGESHSPSSGAVASGITVEMMTH